jgi:hypothetical protein
MSSFEYQPSPIERPLCPRCRTRMMLARRIQISSTSEKRTFDCPKCSFIQTQIADDMPVIEGGFHVQFRKG